MGDSTATQFIAMLDQMSVLVFIVAVLLIIYFVTRYIRFTNRIERISQRDVGVHIVQGNPSVMAMPTGLDRTLIRSLPSFLYKPQQMKNPLECAICLWEFQENEKGRVLPDCNHCFHIDCIDMWLFSHSTCPVCRTKIEVVSHGKRQQLLATENLQVISGCGHGREGQSTSCPAQINEGTPLPQTAVATSM